MYIGVPNPNALIPLKKMTIENLDSDDFMNSKITVLYNPESYHETRHLEYSMVPLFQGDSPLVQVLTAGAETLMFQLFFDSLNAGAEVGGSVLDKAKFAGNCLLPSIGSLIDVRKYTQKIYSLMEMEESVHRPPMLKLEWASLKFTGFLINCTQHFLKFNELGKPLRARLDCVFLEYVDPKKGRAKNPLESPDTTKFRRINEGDSLWALSAKEYGQCSQWRAIADANGLSNPRLLHSGDLVRLPALVN